MALLFGQFHFPELPMRKELSTILIRGVVPGLLAPLLAFPPGLFSQATIEDHIVSPQALQQQVANSSATRAQNIATVTEFLSTPMAERAMRDAHISAVQVRTAIPVLSDEELKNLAARSADAQQKFAAGFISSTVLLLIILGIVIIIVVAAVH
jgi:hypothetical protein